jgi:hypothetical protein
MDGYDVHTVEIVIFDRVDDNPRRSNSKAFYFQVKGEAAYYSVYGSSKEYAEFVSVRKLTERIEGVNER